MYNLKVEQWLPISIEEAWKFFSSPKTLWIITPPDIEFTILSSSRDEEIFGGMKTEYSLKPLFGILVHRETEITKVEKEKMFANK